MTPGPTLATKNVTGYTEAWNSGAASDNQTQHVTFNKFITLPQLTKLFSLNSLHIKSQ